MVLYLKDGGTLSLHVEKEMKWTRDKIIVDVNGQAVELIRIPYLITGEQIKALSKAGSVSAITIVGKDRIISFEENVFSSIVSRGLNEIGMMRGSNSPLSSF